MKKSILIITQKVDINDPILGFFHRWIIEFAKYFKHVNIVCLYKGKYNLPENVKVFSLGKEEGVNRLKYLYRFYKYIWQERNNYDSVFVHMNPIYVVLGGILWRIFGKKVGLWYVHKQKSLILFIAEKLTNIIFTSVPESFTLKSHKVEYFGHGIDISSFLCKKNKIELPTLKILYVGRITKIKNIDTLIKSVKILKDESLNPIVRIIGITTNKEDEYYKLYLLDLINKLNLENNIEFIGTVLNTNIIDYYSWSDISVNLTTTGGIDKVVLESMATKTPVLVSNNAFNRYFGDYSRDLIFNLNDYKNLASKIKKLILSDNIDDIKEYLFNIIKIKFDLVELIKIISLKLK